MRKTTAMVLLSCLAACRPAAHEPEDAIPDSSPAIAAEGADDKTESQIEDHAKFQSPVDID